MAQWEEHRYDGGFRWVNEHQDEVRISQKPVEEQYRVRFKLARSDIVTTVPNGRKDSFEEAVSYAVDVVMRGDRIEHLSDRGDVSRGEDVYARQLRVGDYLDPALLSSEYCTEHDD